MILGQSLSPDVIKNALVTMEILFANRANQVSKIEQYVYPFDDHTFFMYIFYIYVCACGRNIDVLYVTHTKHTLKLKVETVNVM